MKKLFLTVVAMLGATTLFAQTDIVTLAKQATDSAKAGNFDEAITLFDEVINSYWYIKEPTANDEKALAMAQKYIVTCYNKLGGRAWNAKDYETAIEYFTQAANNAELYNNEVDRVKNLSYVGNCYEAMGATAFNNGNFEEAIEVFSKGYAADSRNTNMALNLAESYFKSNKYQDGMRVCSEVASLNANKYAEAIAAAHAKMDLYTNNEVAKLQQANDYDGIIALANELPDAAIAQKVIMQAYYGKKDFKKMVEISGEAIAAQTTDEGRSNIYYLLGVAYNELEMFDKAVEAMTNVTAGNNVANAQAVIEALTAQAE